MIDLAVIVDALRNAPNYNAGLGTSTLEDEAADAIEQLIERVRELEAERDAAVADLSTFKDGFSTDYFKTFSAWDEVEVIDNIYDNPEPPKEDKHV